MFALNQLSKHFNLKFYLPSLKSSREKKKRSDLTSIYEQIMIMDDAILDSDVRESVVNELLKQNVIPFYVVDSFF